jgi:nucleotide-binding universal stress UspA family protein
MVSDPKNAWLACHQSQEASNYVFSQYSKESRRGEIMYQKILVPLDGSELAECVLPHVEEIASGCRVGSIILVRAVEPLHLPAALEYDVYARKDLQEEWQKAELEERSAAQDYLNRLANRMRKEGRNVQAQVLVGRVAESVADYAAKEGVDLIVMATHGRSGIGRWVWGSTADRLLRSSCVPILMVRAPGCVPGI